MSSVDEPRYEVVYARPMARLGERSLRRWRPALAPASWVYQCVSNTVARVRALERAEATAGATVVSVGNLVAGGGGKTPFCLHLVETLEALGRSVAYVSRGYRSRAERFDGLTLVCEGAATGPGRRVLSRGAVDLVEEVGDEGALVAERAPGVPLVFSRDKARAVEAASGLVGDGVVVVDDAFQSWSLARDIDVVLLDAKRPLGDGWLLPAGSLREEPAALERADVLVFNGATNDEEVSRAASVVWRATGVVRPTAGLRRELRLARTPEGPVLVVSAIARPESFERMAGKVTDVAVAMRYPDHHRYGADDAVRIREVASKHRCGTIVTTEKDWVKLRRVGFEEREVTVARLDARLTDESIVGTITKPQTRASAASR